MVDKECMQELVTLFLKINPDPSDEQFHALACAVGVDHETLEACAYEMLGESDVVVDAQEIDAMEIDAMEIDASELLADSQDILEDDISPDVMPLNDVATNDGDNTLDDSGMQEESNDDGADVHDVGVGMTSTDGDDVLQDDGVVAPGGV